MMGDVKKFLDIDGLKRFCNFLKDKFERLEKIDFNSFATKTYVDQKANVLPDLSKNTDTIEFQNYDVPIIQMYNVDTSKASLVTFAKSSSTIIFAKYNDIYEGALQNKWWAKKYSLPTNMNMLAEFMTNFGGVAKYVEVLDTSKCNYMGAAFAGCRGKFIYKDKNIPENTLDVTWIDCTSCQSIYSMFSAACYSVINAGMKNMNQVLECSELFALSLWNVPFNVNGDYNILHTINFGSNFDLRSVINNAGNVFRGRTKLTTLTGTFKWTSIADLDAGDCPLTADSAMVLINGLPNLSDTTHNLKLSETTFDSLSEEQIAVATTKGWTVSK